MITFTIPRMRLVNSSNVREHWSKRAERAATQRLAARTFTRRALDGTTLSPPYECTITRIGPGKMDRSNIYVAAKAIEDGICDALGVNDGDEAAWVLTTRQEAPPKGSKGVNRYGVRVEIRERGADV